MLNMARSQAELRQSEERYRNLADNLPDYILVHDGEFIRYANPAAARLMGPSRGNPCRAINLFPPDPRKC